MQVGIFLKVNTNLQPNNVNLWSRLAPEDWKSHYTLAFCLNKTGHFSTAKLQAAIAAEQAPEEYIAQSLYADLCITEGDWDSCRRGSSRILARLDENDSATQKTLGLIAEHEKKGDILSAESHFTRIVEKNPDNIGNVLTLSDFFFRYGTFGKALLLLRRSIRKGSAVT